MAKRKPKIIAGYAQMWPREVFDIRDGKKKLLDDVKRKLEKPGVYVLYRDDHPYYVGKTTRPLFDRIWAHANASGDRYYNFWNFFSAFEVSDKSHLGEVEGILIAAMSTANSAVPRIKEIKLPARVVRTLGERRRIDVNHPGLTTK